MPEETQRDQLSTEIVEAFVGLVLTQKFADMPYWLDFDLTVSQVRAVYFLAYHHSLAISQLASLLGIGNPAASILVQGLVEQDLVRRSEDPQDRRRTLVQLTSRGGELVSGRREQREAKVRRWLDHLSDDELTGLAKGLRALLEIVTRA